MNELTESEARRVMEFAVMMKLFSDTFLLWLTCACVAESEKRTIFAAGTCELLETMTRCSCGNCAKAWNVVAPEKGREME